MKKIIIVTIFLLFFCTCFSLSHSQSYDIQQFSFPNSGAWSSSIPSYNSSNYYDPILQYNKNSFDWEQYFDRDAQSSGWYNHSPLFSNNLDSPLNIKAGQTATAYVSVVDPDMENVFYSSNFGSTGRTAGGDITWTFTPTFPGLYVLNTLAYDPRGGYVSQNTVVHVRPWWSR